MSKYESIRTQLEYAVSVNHPELVDKVREEMDVMEVIEDLDGKGCALEKLYSIWTKAKGRRGHQNKINSWTAYGIGLTDKTPSGEFLPLRRAFARAGFPDIDSDFQDDRREEVVDHIISRYGRHNVGNIGTYAQMHMKSVIRSLIKVLDLAGAYYKGEAEYTTQNKLKGDEVVGSLPKPQGNKIIWTEPETGENVEIKNVSLAYKHVPDFRAYMDKNPDIMRHAQNLEGLNSTFSVHASGIVVSSEPLANLAPMRPAKKKTIEHDDGTKEKIQSYATQFAYEDCEVIGLIKFDVLAIKTLTAIKQCIDMVKKNWDISIDVETLPLNDRKTFNLFRTGNLTAVFQCEKWGMQDTCKKIGVDRFEDIMAAIALYRPGPMENIPTYIARKKGQQKIDYFHPSIEPLVKKYLEKTYGVCVYQEQIMQICMAIAGFSITDGYVVIKAVGKKKLDLLAKFQKQFVDGAIKNGVPKEVAEAYWGHIDEGGKLHGFILPFANYGFNAAHSCCYGYNSYLTAYLKAHYIEEYMTSCLNVESERKKWVKVLNLEQDCKRNNIVFSKRSLDTCGLTYEIVRHANHEEGVNAEIRPSILCKGLGIAAAKEIVRQQPFKDMRDFATRTGKMVDNSSVEALAAAGFFKKPTQAIKDFATLREDLKKATRKNVESADMFED